MKLASEEARKTAAPATSSGSQALLLRGVGSGQVDEAGRWLLKQELPLQAPGA